jgi:hypothetical protein
MALDTLDILALDSAAHKQAVLDLKHDLSSNEANTLLPKRVVGLNNTSKRAIFLWDNASMSCFRRDGIEYICGSLSMRVLASAISTGL